MIDHLLDGLVRANLTAAIAVLLVLALRRPMRGRWGARAAYGLWAMVPLAALASLLPRASAGALPDVVLAAGAAAGRAVPETLTPDWGGLALVAVWLAGALATAAVLLRQQRSFMAALGRLQPLAGQPGVLRAEHAGVGPAVVGAWRPRIITPADFEIRYDAEERGVILAHEHAHLSRGDAWTNAAAAAAQCASWFNPLVHLGVRRMRIDQELACDAAVLERLPHARKLYGEVLLKAQLGAQALPVGCHWPANAEHPLKERIAMLKSPLPAGPRRTAGLVMVAALSLGGACAAWAAQPAPQGAPAPVVRMPDWIARPDGADIARFYPTAAKAAKLEGRATIACRVDDEGRLGKCQLINEAPAGAGFGDAALALADRFQMKPVDRNGMATAGQDVRIPFKFALPSAPAA
jgi:TonB family protein